MSSQIEELPLNIMEVMACELPIIATNIKGIMSWRKTKNGILFAKDSLDEFVRAWQGDLAIRLITHKSNVENLKKAQ